MIENIIPYLMILVIALISILIISFIIWGLQKAEVIRQKYNISIERRLE